MVKELLLGGPIAKGKTQPTELKTTKLLSRKNTLTLLKAMKKSLSARTPDLKPLLKETSTRSDLVAGFANAFYNNIDLNLFVSIIFSFFF